MAQAWSEWKIWSYAGTVTQTAVGGGTLVVDVTAGTGNVMEVLFVRAEGTFTAVDDLVLNTLDEDNNGIVTFAGATASGTVNATYPRANTNVDSTSSTTYGSPPRRLKLAGPDLKFTAQTTALAQNDTVELFLQALVSNGPGTISIARSGGTTSAVTETVNEVY